MIRQKMATSLQKASCCHIYRILRSLQPGNCSQVPTRNANIISKFWRRSPATVGEEEPEDTFKPLQAVTAVDRLQSLKKRSGVQTVRGYTPPSDVEDRLQRLVTDVYGEHEDWREITLSDRLHKYEMLSRAIKEFDHNIPNMVLTRLQTVEDVIAHFSTEVRETSSLEDISKLDLPRNLHINLDYIRFDKESDSLFDGKTAFPDRPTIVKSIKYRRKYKGYSNKDE